MYYEDQFHKEDMYKTWKTIKEIIGKTDQLSTTLPAYIVDGIPTNDPSQICNTFNDCYKKSDHHYLAKLHHP